MWARLHVRSMRLGYFQGGFQAFIDRLTAAVQERGATIHLNTPVDQVTQEAGSGRFTVAARGDQMQADQVLVTTSPALLSQMAPQLPPEYLAQLLELKSMGAVVMTLALDRPLLPDRLTYWLNIPSVSPDKQENEIPFLALVEHTNFISPEHYGGDHLIYCGDYLTPDHPHFSLSQEELEARFIGVLSKFNPAFRREWVRRSWLFRARYAQPVPFVNHSQAIPDIRTPLPGLYFASMSQVYPWDRGTNYAVEIGRRAARLLITGQ
jgi:protoporphyrinogen oxidase